MSKKKQEVSIFGAQVLTLIVPQILDEVAGL